MCKEETIMSRFIFGTTPVLLTLLAPHTAAADPTDEVVIRAKPDINVRETVDRSMGGVGVHSITFTTNEVVGSCVAVLNDGYGMSLRVLAPERPVTVREADFANGSGERFNEAYLKAITLRLRCKAPEQYHVIYKFTPQ
jgi:hypothetical protein